MERPSVKIDADRPSGPNARSTGGIAIPLWLVQAIFLGLLALSSMSLHGQLTHFTRRIWGVSDGLPEPIVQILGQDRDGFLLVGTSGGLSRFDGARFASMMSESSQDPLPFPIYCLVVARDGSIWAGTEGAGLLHLTQGRLTRFTAEEGLTDSFVRGLLEDPRGRIWAGTDNGLFVFENGRFRRVDDAASSSPLAVAAIALDDHQRIWAGGSDLVVVDGAHFHTLKLPGAYSQNRVKSLLQARDGTFWVGTVGGLLREARGSFHPVAGIAATVRSLTQTSDGTVWIGTIGQGLWNTRSGVPRRVDQDTMLPSQTVLTVFEDGSRRIWIGTQSGLVRLEPTSVEVVPLPGHTQADYGTLSDARNGTGWMVVQNMFRITGRKALHVAEPGFPRSGLRSVFTVRDGSLWVGTDGQGAYHRDLAGHVSHLLAPRELTNDFVRAFLEGSDGSVWIGTDQGIARILPQGKIVKYTVADGLCHFSIRDLLEDSEGDIWIGTDKGLSHWHRGSFLQDTATAALKEEKVWSILRDRQGTFWFGTRDHGLFRYRGGAMAHYTAAQGLSGNSIYKILQDHGGTFWISGPDSISSFPERVLDGSLSASEWLPGLQYHMPFEADGAQMYGGRQSSGYVASDNTVWFPTDRGAAHVLAASADTVDRPTVRIIDVAQDGRSLPVTNNASVSARSTRLDLNYAPLFLGSQQGIRFSYKLEGFDHQWVQAGSARTASYTNLPPGDFRFRVAVFDTAHPERRGETSLQIFKQRFFYQTWWFRCGCVLVAFALVFGGYRVHLQRIQAEFDATLKERARIAREMHDTVIQGCTGISVLLEAMASQEGAALEGNTLFQHARTQIVATVDEARDMVWNLRHAEKIDLAASLEALARQASQAFGIEVAYSGSEYPGMVSHLVGHEALMIAREALANSASHAEPSAICIALSRTTDLWTMAIADNGKGFESPSDATKPPHRHYGVIGMRERAGRIGATLQLRSSPGTGTEISLRLNKKDLLRTSPVKART